jgi:polysaccharide export outer membrane protein
MGALLFIAPLWLMAATGSYQLKAGDVISILVYGEEDLSFDKLLVGESGYISYPFVGEIKLSGLTLADLEARLIAGLKPDYLIDPKISVSIVEYRPFYISGEVKDPGSFPYQPGITLHQAVSVAGGFTERASKSKIYVVHDDDPSRERQRVDLHYEVKPGDTISVEQSFF